ncbi:MAG: NAD(P)-binding domain-containing protein [Deltaproteobacteria bacterium]|nr:NAD(P)-binding domain-containing protein [Deltaproteobacteria bacterium]
MSETVGVLGAGRMGRALCRWVLRAGHRVLLWDRSGSQIPARLALDPADRVEVAASAAEVAAAVRTILVGLPASAVGPVFETMGARLRADHEILHTSKGVAPGFRLVSELIRAECGARQIAALGGPLLATELEEGNPLAVVVASRFDRFVARLRGLLADGRTWLFGSRDLVGLEIAGAMRNVSAIAMGICEGADVSETSRALILTRGLLEAARIGAHFGADRDTFIGLGGVGDLVARRQATYSRNFRLGARLAAGDDCAKVAQELAAEVEGVVTARAAADLADRTGLTLAVASAVDRVCRGAPARAEIDALLSTELPLGPSARLL